MVFGSPQAKQKADALLKKAEAKQLAAQEEAEIAAKKPAKAKAAAGKVIALFDDFSQALDSKLHLSSKCELQGKAEAGRNPPP